MIALRPYEGLRNYLIDPAYPMSNGLLVLFKWDLLY